MMRWLIFISIPLLLAAADANELPKRTPQQEIQIAKQAASRESWAEAAAALARAQEGQGKVDSLLAYDQAVAAYRAGDLTQAAAAFERALNSGDPEIAAAAAYNLGNTNYQLAMAPVESEGDSKKQLDQAADRFAQALEQYRHAIEQNSLDRDARANGELAWQKLQEVLQEQERQEQQEQEQEQEQDQQENAEDQEDQEGQEGQGEPQSEDEMNQDQQKSDDQEKQEEPSGQQKKEQQQQSEEQKQQEQEQPEDDQQSQDEQQQPQNQEEEQQDKSESQPNQDQQDSAEPKAEQSKDSAGGQSKTPGKMTKEEAERMLQSIRDREKQRRQDQQQIEAAGAATTGKDW
jgi:Ca-activated chloride channel family protein